ncbi:hypothetical protein EBQ93_00050, partial [bacterium]|nr:hypothetical protein [bacterium]
KKNLGGIFDNQGKEIQFDISNHFIQIWKQQAYEIINRKCHHLKFEDWINSPKIRQQFLFENFKIFEIWDHTQVKGTVSSFEDLDKSKINDRVSQVEFTDQTKSLVNSDNELKDLILELGYPLKQL